MVSKPYIPLDIGNPTFMQLWTDAWQTDKACYTEFPFMEKFILPPISWCDLFSVTNKTVFLVLTHESVVSFCPLERIYLHVPGSYIQKHHMCWSSQHVL